MIQLEKHWKCNKSWCRFHAGWDNPANGWREAQSGAFSRRFSQDLTMLKLLFWRTDPGQGKDPDPDQKRYNLLPRKYPIDMLRPSISHKKSFILTNIRCCYWLFLFALVLALSSTSKEVKSIPMQMNQRHPPLSSPCRVLDATDEQCFANVNALFTRHWCRIENFAIIDEKNDSESSRLTTFGCGKYRLLRNCYLSKWWNWMVVIKRRLSLIKITSSK